MFTFNAILNFAIEFLTLSSFAPLVAVAVFIFCLLAMMDLMHGGR